MTLLHYIVYDLIMYRLTTVETDPIMLLVQKETGKLELKEKF